jgi:hypothetical protein
MEVEHLPWLKKVSITASQKLSPRKKDGSDAMLLVVLFKKDAVPLLSTENVLPYMKLRR